MRYLVTGGAGFIGSHLTQRLLRDGHKVTILDTFTTGRHDNLAYILSDNLTIFEGSVLDRHLLKKLAAEVDFVFHLAAAVGVFNIVRDPLRSLQINIQGTERILEIATDLNLPVLITSSSEVYGKNTSNKLNEDDDRVLGPTSIARWSYSEAKAIDEFLAISFYNDFSLPSRIVRLFNTVGPRQVGNYGMVIPRFVSSSLKNEQIEIYGTGEQTRCFTHVLDVIDALLLISNSDKTIGEVINIGNDFEITISNLAKKIVSMTDSKSEIVYRKYEEIYEKDFEDMQRRVPDISKIKRLTGWTPTRDLDSILLDVIAYEKNGS